MSGPKLVVIGAGSYFFGKPVIRKMATSPVMAGGTLALVDSEPAVLATMARLARRICSHTTCGVKVMADTDRRRVMKNADFVVLTFSKKNAWYRGVDTRIALKHGITMCSSDTIGPGGIFRALREVPRALAMARDAERLCPNAWLINFVNPSTVLGMALHKYAPNVRSFALCDSHHDPSYTAGVAAEAGIVPPGTPEVPPEIMRHLDIAVGGVNHFTWIFRCRYRNRNMFPAMRRSLLKHVREEKKHAAGSDSKSKYNFAYTLQLFDLFEAYPDCIGHTKEYLPYYQGYGIQPAAPEEIQPFDAGARMRDMARAWKRTEAYADGKPGPKSFLRHVHDDHASDIIESVWGGMRKQFYINTLNRGAVTNLPDDAYLEVKCDVDMQGPRPHTVGNMPRGILGMQHIVLDTHELTAAAAVTGDRSLLRRAMLTDQICNNIADADACIRDLIHAEKNVLPDYWQRR